MIAKIKRYFEIEERGSTIGREVNGGIVTLLAGIYIVMVHPMIMSYAGMDPARVFTSTAIAAGLGTLVMAFLGKLPIMLAPGMGINAFVAFTVCLGLGFHWSVAILAIFFGGLCFIVMSVTGLREKIIYAIPDTLKKAVAFGIGFFIAIIGLNNAGILNSGGGTPLAINAITSGGPLVAIIGLFLMFVLYAQKIPGSIFIAIIVAAIVGIPLGVTQIPEGFRFFSMPAAPYLPSDVIAGLHTVSLPQFFIVFLTLLIVEIFDTVATFAGLAEQSGLKDKNGNILNCKRALLSDAITTPIGAAFGATTVTSYIESSAGMAAGARTGFASVITGIGFLFALCFSSVFMLIPAAATAPALIFVGFLMLGALAKTELKELTVGLPVFMTVLMMVASYDISKGLAYGFVTYILTMVFSKRIKEISIPTWVLGGIFLLYIFFSPK